MKRILFALASAGLLFAMTPFASARKWTSSDGKFSIDADLVSVADGKVTLKKANDAAATVPVDRLSDADRQYIASSTAKAAAPAKAISFSGEIRPLLSQCCVDCHRQKKARGGVRLENYADMIKPGKKGTPVIPGNAAESRVIVTHAGGKPHPANDSKEAKPEDKKTKALPLTAERLALLEAWIKAGAKEDGPAR